MGIVKKQSFHSSLYLYIGLALGSVSTIILFPSVFNSHPEHLGLLQIIVAYSTVASTFSLLGSPQVLIRFFPIVKNKNQLITLAFLVSIVGFLLLLLLFIIFKEDFLQFIKPYSLETDEIRTYFLLKSNFHLVFLLVAFIALFEVFSSLSFSLLRSSVPIFLKEVFLRTINILFLILHWFEFIDFPTFLKLYISSYLVMTILLSLTILKNYSFKIKYSFDEIKIKELLTYGLYVLLGGASAILVSKVDMIMIGKFVGFKEVAYYTISFFIGNVVRIPARAIAAISMPLIAKAWSNNDIKSIRDIYVKSSINQLILGGFIFLGVWMNIDDGLSLLPLKFKGGKLIVLFISISQLFNVATGLNGLIISNSKYYKFDLYSNFILLLITIFSNFIFIPTNSPLANYDIVGINGAAFATALSVFIYNTIKLIYLYWKLKIQPFNIKTLYTILLLISIITLSYFIPKFENLFINISFRSILILIIFIPIMYWLKLSDDINKIIKDSTLK
jgi:O-antigen/teichoic acid export membrane protein